MPAVVHAWLSNPEAYAPAVTTMIRLGGDTDTTAALVGAIVGARVGRRGIPRAWIDRIAEWPRTAARIETLGMRALHAARTRTRRPRIRVFLPAILLRNTLFMLIVLAHGLRRLLPPYR